MEFTNTEDLIRQYVSFKHQSSGWNACYCEYCGDGKRQKGPRAGFLFQNDVVMFHCFNCGMDGSFSPAREFPWSRGMNKVFDSFGIPKASIMQLIKATQAINGVKSIPQKHTRPLQPISLPKHFYPLSSAAPDNIIANAAKTFLKDVKHINPESYPFYLSTCITDANDPDAAFIKSLRNRLIIPFFKGTQLIYYIARSLDEDSNLKYLNLNKPKSNIIYGYDRLYEDEDNILFVTEGFTDAYHVKGVAVLENSMTQDQIEILEQSPRRKIVIPDRKGDSNRLAEQAVELGWGLSLPKIGRCKDVTEGILEYGKLYILDSIMKNIKEGRAAQTALKFI